MNYNVSQLLKEPIGSDRVFSITEGELSESGHPQDNATGAVRLVRTHHGIWVQGDLTVMMNLECGRCLEGFKESLDLEIDEEFFPEVDVKTGRLVHAPDDWEGFYIGTDHILDLSEATRQSALATLPLKPLCKPDCVGICDMCGSNRNLNNCDCYANFIDPRWSALRSLIIEPED